VSAIALAFSLLLAAAEDFSYGELRFAPCVLGTGGMAPPAQARCGTLEVPEDPGAPEGRRITLALAWAPATARAEPEPVFFLAGGPGQSSRDAYPMLAAAFTELRRSRDLFFLDQRGTGGSNRLDCPTEESPPAGWDEESLGEARAFAARCREALSVQADLRFYRTREAVADLERVRERLGAARIWLIGVSYGTRLAQDYARRHPERVAGLVLDGVVAPSRPFAPEVAGNLENALARQFRRCAEEPACAERIGDPAALLASAKARLREARSAPLRFRDPTSGEWREQALGYAGFAGVLRMYAYQPLGAALLPRLVLEVAQGDDAVALALARMLERDLSGQMALGMQLSVLCTEDADTLSPRPGDEKTLLGTMFVQTLAAFCAEWPRGTPDPERREPLRGAFPALLLSGEFDPVTPPAYAEIVAEHLPRARHLVLPGQGHHVLAAGCMPRLLAQFLERGEAESLDTSCLKQLSALPFVTGPYGWEP
jgi:pimeloyl-ACP methyl ester carboxylesterase